MIISCTSCEAKYLVDPVQISVGRQVRCARCNFSWFQDNTGFEVNESVSNSEEVIEKRNPESDKNLPAVYKEKKKLSRDKTAIIILILFIVSALGIDHFNKIDPVEMLYIKYSTIEILQNIFLPR